MQKKMSNVYIGILIIFICFFITLYSDQIRGSIENTFGLSQMIPNALLPIWNILDFAAVVFVVGGTIGSTIAGFPLKMVWKAFRYLFKYVLPVKFSKDIHGVNTNFNKEKYQIHQIAFDLAKKRHKRESIQADITYFRSSFELSPMCESVLLEWLSVYLIDGDSEPAKEKIEEMIGAEIAHIEARANEDLEVLEFMTQASPAFGIAGTVTGLVLLLRSDVMDIGAIETLVQPMSIALLTTLYGVMLSNVLFNPALAKRTQLKAAVTHSLAMMRDTLIYLKERRHPNDISDLLLGYLPADLQAKRKAEVDVDVVKQYSSIFSS